MSIAFLLLTYEEHIQSENIKNFLINGNIYVHPKYPDKINSYLKDYIIEDLFETDWGNINIVQAEINLLKESFKNENNEWFILMSDTCYPMINYNQLLSKLNNINLSCFNVTAFFIVDNIKIYKTSQFWILKRIDVEIILKHYNKYIDFFNKEHNTIQYNNGVPDETFFLTILMNECKNYMFYNNNTTFVRKINLINNLHPFTINKLTYYDIELVKKSYFIRKVSNTFSDNIYQNNINLVIIYLDKIINKEIEKYVDDNIIDIIVFYSDNVKKSLPLELMKKSLYSINIYYKTYYEAYILFKIDSNQLFSQWKNISFVEIM